MEFLGTAINPVAILMSGIAAFLLGWVWYSALFSAPWVEAQRFTPEQKRDLGKNMPMVMGTSFVGYLVTAVALAVLLGFSHTTEFSQALPITLAAWLGFSVMPSLMHSMYTGRSLTGLAIDMGYELVYMIVMAFILTWWK